MRRSEFGHMAYPRLPAYRNAAHVQRGCPQAPTSVPHCMPQLLCSEIREHGMHLFMASKDAGQGLRPRKLAQPPMYIEAISAATLRSSFSSGTYRKIRLHAS
eukprot:scaffold341196_cov45-Prasinocladus_malaysianus.AAC.1